MTSEKDDLSLRIPGTLAWTLFKRFFLVTTAEQNLKLSHFNEIMCQPFYNKIEKLLDLARN